MSRSRRCSGTLRCNTVQVQARIVNRELHRMSIVPRVLADETKLTDVEGSVQLVSKIVCAFARVKRERRPRLRAIL